MGSTPATSRALYADQDGKLVVRHVPFPEPQEGELLIEVLYSGVNPADTKVIDFFGLKKYVIGTEFCGEVLESKTLVSTSFKAGDIVAGVLSGGQNPPLRWGTHQEFMTIVASWAWKVPENLPPQDAAGLSIVGLTAATGLFNDIGLPLPPGVAKGTPDEGVAAPEGTLVIWGSATSVGMAAIQFARAARVSSIIAIASSKRHEYLKTLGATQSFDYNDTNVIEKVKSALQSTSGTIWALDARGSSESQALLKKAIPQHGKTVLASVMVGGDPEYKGIMGARHFDVEFELPGGKKMSWPRDRAAADRHWRGFRWAVENYGAPGGYVPMPGRVFEGSGEDAIKEVYNVKNMTTFGKLMLKHPLK
ncbi:zinc-type alcohol dehydrogenase [Fusarium phyllophilum]|uniref:Zinc-type alcohol dehydrogenase n=1 Tax=Fusarium phyllophilum TaxID=47803 RepID=A0A8H5NK99_9HYPO|nr:zinc-type alcohol dehydrogenase [Fusarium phyllophilum]